jgi:thiamine-monophosphate kinase
MIMPHRLADRPSRNKPRGRHLDNDGAPGNISGEDRIIERIRRRIPSVAHGALRLGIGDDAAIVRPAPGHEFVVTCDQFLENTHFVVPAYPPDAVGYKALARATSDLAAMGASPRVFLLSLALPASRAGAWLDAVIAGMAKAAREFGLTLGGGDTARSSGPHAATTFSITVIGEMEAGRAIPRDGARRGDAIFVTGVLGAAQLGLTLLLDSARKKRALQSRWKPLLVPQLYPKPCIELGRWLARKRLPSAMMDLSDGLSTDLSRLCRASGVGARLYEKAIPCVAVPEELSRALHKKADSLGIAFHGGEDYGLLFTVLPNKASRIPSVFRGVRITRIGEIVQGRGIVVASQSGRLRRLAPAGWDHFRLKDGR